VDQTKWGAGSTGYNLLGIDAEPDGSDDEDGADDEPSLGSNTTIAASYFFQRSRAREPHHKTARRSRRRVL